MNNKFSDEKIDRIAAQLVNDFSLDSSKLDEIADSPQLWWNVRKNIGADAIVVKKGWFAGLKWMVPAFGIIALGICFGAAVLMFSAVEDSAVAEKVLPVIAEPTENRIAVLSDVPQTKPNEVAEPTNDSAPAENRPEISVVRQKTTPRTPRPIVSPKLKTPSPEKSETETAESKTDFIALSYAGNSEGGQVVRVKVPSAMMVTLGVVSEVKENSAMVSAEVVVGDDGLARAIRFIR